MIVNLHSHRLCNAELLPSSAWPSFGAYEPGESVDGPLAKQLDPGQQVADDKNFKGQKKLNSQMRVYSTPKRSEETVRY